MAFKVGFGEGEDVMTDINVTPLVDVMLVLLIIFMVTVPMLHQGIEVALPQTEATISSDRPRKGDRRLNGSPQGQLSGMKRATSRVRYRIKGMTFRRTVVITTSPNPSPSGSGIST